MRNKPVNWGFKCWSRCGSKLGYLFRMYLGKKGNTEYGLVNYLFYRFMKLRLTTIVMDIMITSLNCHLLKGYIGRINRKHMSSLKPDK